MASDDQSILHLVNPIARFGDFRMMRHQEQSLSLFLHNSLRQFEGAREFALSRFPVGSSARMTLGLLARARATATRCALRRRGGGSPPQFAAKADGIEQVRGAFVHLRLAQRGQAPHRDHHVSCAVKLERKWN